LLKQRGLSLLFSVSYLIHVDDTYANRVARLLRHVSAMGYLTEVGQDQYELNNFTKSMAFPFINAGYPCM
jgi:hypothetical protein